MNIHPLGQQYALAALSQVIPGFWSYDLAEMAYQHESGFYVTSDAVMYGSMHAIVDAFKAYINEHPQLKPSAVKISDPVGALKVNPLTGEASSMKTTVEEYWTAGPALVVLPRQLTKKMAGQLYKVTFSTTYNGTSLSDQDLQVLWVDLIAASPGGGLVPMDILKKHATVELSYKLQEYMQTNLHLNKKLAEVGAQAVAAGAALEGATSDYEKLAEVSMESMGELTDQVEQMTHFAKASLNLAEALLDRVEDHGAMPHLVADYAPLLKAMRDELAAILKNKKEYQ